MLVTPVKVLTCDRTPVVVPGDPSEANAAGRGVRQVQIHGRVRTVCRETELRQGNTLQHTHAGNYRHAAVHGSLILYKIILPPNLSINLKSRHTIRFCYHPITPPNLLPIQPFVLFRKLLIYNLVKLVKYKNNSTSKIHKPRMSGIWL